MIVIGTKKVVNQTIGKDNPSIPTCQDTPIDSIQTYSFSSAYSLYIKSQSTKISQSKNSAVEIARGIRDATNVNRRIGTAITSFLPLVSWLANASRIQLTIIGNPTSGRLIQSTDVSDSLIDGKNAINPATIISSPPISMNSLFLMSSAWLLLNQATPHSRMKITNVPRAVIMM